MTIDKLRAEAAFASHRECHVRKEVIAFCTLHSSAADLFHATDVALNVPERLLIATPDGGGCKSLNRRQIENATAVTMK